MLCSHPFCHLHAASNLASTMVARSSDTSVPDYAAFSLLADQLPTSFPPVDSAAHPGRDIAPFRVSEVVNPVTGRHHRISRFPWPIGSQDMVAPHITIAWTSP